MVTDDRNAFSRKDSRPKRRRLSFKLAIGALLVAVAGATYSFRVGSETEALRQQVQAQSQQIDKTSMDVAVVQVLLQKATFEPQSPPGICVCVKKDPGLQVTLLCSAKNPTCDNESREICEAQNPEFDC